MSLLLDHFSSSRYEPQPQCAASVPGIFRKLTGKFQDTAEAPFGILLPSASTQPSFHRSEAAISLKSATWNPENWLLTHMRSDVALPGDPPRNFFTGPDKEVLYGRYPGTFYGHRNSLR